MPKELNIALATTGLTVTAQPYQNGAAVGSAISCPETGSTGFYSGNMAGSAGTYQIAFRAASANVGSGSIVWDGTAEVASSAPSVVQIRQEMDSNSTKLANLDTTVSSRLAASAYTSPSAAPTAAQNATAVWGAATKEITGGTVTTLTNAPSVPSASAIATAVWAAADKTGYSLTSAERTAIATAVEASLINENDGQAIVNAIVNAIGNTNLSQVALVAAIRSDLATELGRIDAAISSRAVPGDIPTETEIAAEVWAKPTTELTITGSIGERAKNQSTVSTTGAQLAAALS